MKHWVVSASTIDFATDVDKGVRFFNGAFEDFNPFSVTQNTFPSSKSLACSSDESSESGDEEEEFEVAREAVAQLSV